MTGTQQSFIQKKLLIQLKEKKSYLKKLVTGKYPADKRFEIIKSYNNLMSVYEMPYL